MTRAAVAVIVSTLVLAVSPRAEAWPTAEQVFDKVAPAMGLKPDEITAAKFGLKHPQCAAKIVSYTVAQDYSLVGFIAALKVSKNSSHPKIPKLTGATCKGLNPVKQAYTFIERQGDQLLGATVASAAKTILAEQIAKGEQAVNEQIAALPYVGTILTNWECGCDAAFETDLKAEAMAVKQVGALISIIESVRGGDYAGALEILIGAAGAKLACQLASDWTAVGSIPIVSDVASSACDKVAGKAVGFVISAASTTAQALGIVGGAHVPPEEYYKNTFAKIPATFDITDEADIRYQKCYKYFESTNMSGSTATKVCQGMRGRFIVEMNGRLDDSAWSTEKFKYFTQLGTRADAVALGTAAEVSAAKTKTVAICKAYVSTAYPRANDYRKAWKQQTIETDCADYIALGKGFDKRRASAQSGLVSRMLAATSANNVNPFCTAQTGGTPTQRNILKCVAGKALDACRQSFPRACVASSTGAEFPCCQQSNYSTADTSTIAFVQKTATSLGKLCANTPDDPFRLRCSTPEQVKTCQQKLTKGFAYTCKPERESSVGLATQPCCELDPSVGAADKTLVAQAVAKANAKSANSCHVGSEKLANDPLTVTCDHKGFEVCKSVIGPHDCTAKQPCCALGTFAGAPDPATQQPTKAGIEAAAKIVAESGGKCSLARIDPRKFGGQQVDKVHIECSTIAAGDRCKAAVGAFTCKSGNDACVKRATANAGCGMAPKNDSGLYVEPCCSLTPDALKSKAPTIDQSKVKAPTKPFKP